MRTASFKIAGFTMIEVLVTMFVVAVGLLGLISLMLRGMQTSADSLLRSAAVAQAYDMADRLRANQTGVTDGDYASLLPTGSATTCVNGEPSTTHVGAASGTIDCSAVCTSNCSASNMAAADACLWHQANQRVLPTGAGVVCKDAGNRWYTIAVSWDENRSGANNKTFKLRFEP